MDPMNREMNCTGQRTCQTELTVKNRTVPEGQMSRNLSRNTSNYVARLDDDTGKS